MRRFFFPLLLLLMVTLVGYMAWQQFKPMLSTAGLDSDVQKRIALSVRSPVYVLDRERWTEFNIPKATPVLRVVTNATLPSAPGFNPAMRWSFSLQYQFIDSAGNVVLQRDYAYRTGARQYKDPESGAVFTSSFYLEPELMPADGHVVSLNLATLPDVTRMRVKLLQADPQILDVAFRAYIQERVPEFRIAHRWLRLSDEQKAGLAKGNVYDQELLGQTEIKNLLRYKEHPLGPTGIAGDAYHSRTLYVMRDYDGEVEALPVRPAGLFVDGYTHGTIALPEGGGKLRLQFIPSAQPPLAGSAIQLRWFGRLLAERSQVDVRWRGGMTEFKGEWRGGLLEVIAEGGLAVRAFLTQAGQPEQEITPPAMYLRAYVADVEYAVDHVGNQATPFRVDLRQALPAGQLAGPVHADYQLLDAQGGVLASGVVAATTAFSLYERIQPDVLAMRLTDPSSYYFSLPASVHAIRLHADKPLLFSAYTRPRALLRQSRVPEDAYLADNGMNRQFSWFALKPKQFQSLIMNHQTMLLATQYRPPQDNPDMLAGRYQWQDFHPQGDWLGRNLFTPIEDVGPQHERALAATYQPLPQGRENLLTLKAEAGIRTVQPRLAYFQRQNRPITVRLYVDGALYYQGRVAGSDGEIVLPALTVGKHRVSVQSSAGAEFYLNHTAARRGSLLKRLANRFEGKTLHFIYQHSAAEEETVALRLYTPAGKRGRSQIRVWLEAPEKRMIGPMRSWSFSGRRFDVRPQTLTGSRVTGSGQQRASVAGHRRAITDQGQPFFISLAGDLPPGNYRLHVALEGGPGGYLLLSRIVPGLVAERRVMFEQELRDGPFQ
ncbi:MAG: hypothetical protein R8K50_03540 [Mariprofundus sp.]